MKSNKEENFYSIFTFTCFCLAILAYAAATMERSSDIQAVPRTFISQDVCIGTLGGTVENFNACRTPSGHLVRIGWPIDDAELLELIGKQQNLKIESEGPDERP